MHMGTEICYLDSEMHNIFIGFFGSHLGISVFFLIWFTCLILKIWMYKPWWFQHTVSRSSQFTNLILFDLCFSCFYVRRKEDFFPKSELWAKSSTFKTVSKYLSSQESSPRYHNSSSNSSSFWICQIVLDVKETSCRG